MMSLAIIGPLLIEQLTKNLCAALAMPMNQMPWWGRLIWFVASAGGYGLIVRCLLRRYPLPASVGASKIEARQHLLPWLVVILPLLIYYLLPMIRFASPLERLASVTATAEQRAELATYLHNGHETVWARIGFGTDGAGVLLGSLLVLAMPVCEEILFRGYLMNIFGRRLGNPYAAVIVVAVPFAALHVFRTANLHELTLLLLAGMGYGLIRLCSGSWPLAWLAHAVINASIMAPKWLLAVCNCWLVPKLLEAQ